MAKGPIKTLSGASYLLVLSFVLMFLFFQSFIQGSAFASLNGVLIAYTIVFGLVLTITFFYSPETIRQLIKAPYWQSTIQKFIPSAIVVSIFLIFVKTLIKGAGSISVFNALSNIPVSVLLVHLFVITQIEEIMFGGLLYTAIQKKNGNTQANIWTAAIFSFFHFAKSGGSLAILITYIPLRLWWNYTRNNGTPYLNKIPIIGQRLFGPTPYTQQANAGAHFAWNAFIIGFIEPFRV
jgi:membrane protease YdiL (CAAX protease family)